MNKDLTTLFEKNVSTFFTDITKNMIFEIELISKANEAALISIWNKINETKEQTEVSEDIGGRERGQGPENHLEGNSLKIKLKESNKKKIIFEDD